jgi:hypothetical protein
VTGIHIDNDGKVTLQLAETAANQPEEQLVTA